MRVAGKFWHGISYRGNTSGAASGLQFLILVAYFSVAAPAALAQSPASAAGSRKVIIDQDASGPGGSDMQAILDHRAIPQYGCPGHHRRHRQMPGWPKKCSILCA